MHQAWIASLALAMTKIRPAARCSTIAGAAEPARRRPHRHCEERSDEAIFAAAGALWPMHQAWIASLSLAMTD
jgi:hypothetical protein